MKNVFYYSDLLFGPGIIEFKIISHHYDNPLAGYSGIKKTQELIAKKYF